jgi:hypothetical protein
MHEQRSPIGIAPLGNAQLANSPSRTDLSGYQDHLGSKFATITEIAGIAHREARHPYHLIK